MLYGTLAPTGAGSADIHPLGYYAMLWLWMQVFGESLIATRTLSIIAGLTSVYLVYRISLELFDKNTARLAMLIAALAPFQIHYAQEIRMYAFLSMWLLLATFAYLRGEKTNQLAWWILFAVAAALAQYTHNLAVFYLAALAITPVIKRDWKTAKNMVVAGLFAMLLYAPWLIQLPAQFQKIQQGYWVEKPDISKIFTLPIVYITNTPLPADWVPFGLLLSLFIVAIGLIQTIRFLRNSDKINGVWVAYMVFAPPALLFLFSQWKPVYIERALLPSGAMFCIWLACVITSINLSKWAHDLLTGALVIAFAMGIYEHVTYHDFPYGPFQELDKSLRSRVETNDVILHSNKLTMLPAILYDPELPQLYIGDPPGSGTDTLAPATQQVLGISAKKDIQSATQNASRVWYIIFQQALDEYQSKEQPYPDIEYLNSQFSLKSQENWGGLQVFLYAQKP